MKHSRAKNLVDDLLDLNSRIVADEAGDTFHVSTDMRVGRAEVDRPAGVLSTRRAFLELGLDGLDISLGKRHGEPLRAPIIEKIKDRTASKKKGSTSIEASAGAGLAGVKASARVRAKAGVSMETSSESTINRTMERSAVKARGGNRWEIHDGGAELDHSYIMSDTPLCKIERVAGANHTAVTVSGYVLRKDLEFKFDSSVPLLRNREKAILAFLARKMEIDELPGAPKITLSTQEFYDE